MKLSSSHIERNKILVILIILAILFPALNYEQGQFVNANASNKFLKGHGMIRIPSPFPNSHPISVDWSPDGKYIAVTYYGSSRSGKGFALYDAETFEPIIKMHNFPPVGYAGTLMRVRWSPDGEYLVIAVGQQYGHGGFAVYRFNRTSKKLELAWYTRVPGPRGIAWSHDGSKVALVYDYYYRNSRSPNVQVFTRNGTLLWKKRISEVFFYGVAWSPDDKLLAIGGRTSYGTGGNPGYYHGKIYVLNASNGNVVWYKHLDQKIFTIIWLGNPSRILVGGFSGTIKVYNESGSLVYETQQLGRVIQEMRLSPDGNRIVVGVRWNQNPNYLGRLIVMNSNLSILWERRQPRAEVWGLSWSPNGSLIAYGGASPYLTIADEKGSIVWESGLINSSFNTMAFIDDYTAVLGGNGWIASTSLSGEVRWNVTTGFPVAGIAVSRTWGEIVVYGPVNYTDYLVQFYTLNGVKISEKHVENPVTVISIHPRRPYLAIGESPSTVEIWNIRTFSKIQSINTTGTPHAVSWTYKLPFMAVATSNQVLVYNVGMSSYRVIYNYTSNGSILDIDYNPATRDLSILENNGTSIVLRTFKTAINSVKEKWNATIGFQADKIQWSPTGSRIALYGSTILGVYDYNGTFLWETMTFDAYKLSTRYPAYINPIKWMSNETKILSLTTGSTWITVFNSGPYPPPSGSSIPTSGFTTVGGTLLDENTGYSLHSLIPPAGEALLALLLILATKAYSRKE